MSVLLDTHILIWWTADPGSLSREEQQAMSNASTLLVSPLSCWEVGMLASKGRIRLAENDPFVWARRLFAHPKVEEAGLTPQAAVRAALLEDLGDPTDRFLVATAMHHRVPMITRDRRIRRLASKDRAFSVV